MGAAPLLLLVEAYAVRVLDGLHGDHALLLRRRTATAVLATDRPTTHWISDLASWLVAFSSPR
ncbi:MAG: hypothetical protein ACRDRJ_00960 [Streptosporangiaceae bacterium]